MAVKCLKLVSQEEIIVEVTNETGEFVQFKNPLMLMLVGEGQLGLFPWLPLADKSEFTLKTDKILIDYVPKIELINTYKQRTGGIVMAGANTLNQLPKTPPNFGK